MQYFCTNSVQTVFWMSISSGLQGQHMYLSKEEVSQYLMLWGFTAQSTQWGHVDCGQFTLSHFYWAGLVL